MNEKERKVLSERILNAIAKAQRKLVEQKAKLGENVVIADKNGQPLIISAKDALHLYTGKAKYSK